MISHMFREIMGDKPYLSVEVDEHQSAVGVVTRIEAFLNSLKHVENVKAGKDVEGVRKERQVVCRKREEMEKCENTRRMRKLQNTDRNRAAVILKFRRPVTTSNMPQSITASP